MDLGRPGILRGIVIALAVVVGAVVYLMASEGGEEPAAAPEAVEARIVDTDGLGEVAADADYPIYWAGGMDGAELELTVDEGGALVRYLDEQDDPGAALARRVAVGSYTLSNPRTALNIFARTPGASVEKVRGVGKVVIGPKAGKSVFFVDPDNEVRVEVFAPSAKQAIGLVRSGRVQPIG